MKIKETLIKPGNIDPANKTAGDFSEDFGEVCLK